MFARWLLFSLMFMFPFFAWGQSSTVSAHKCYKNESHASARECLEKIALSQAVLLKDTESKLRSTLQEWDQTPEDKTRALIALNEGATNFESYVKSQCDFQASIAAGGNAATNRRLLCEIELKKKRVAELQSTTKGLQ